MQCRRRIVLIDSTSGAARLTIDGLSSINARFSAHGGRPRVSRLSLVVLPTVVKLEMKRCICSLLPIKRGPRQPSLMFLSDFRTIGKKDFVGHWNSLISSSIIH